MNPIESIRDLQERLNNAVRPLGLEALQVSLTPGSELSVDTLHCTFAVDQRIAFKSQEELDTERQFREIALNERAQESIRKYDEARQDLINKLTNNNDDETVLESDNKVEFESTLPPLDDEILEMDISEILRRLEEN